MIQEAELDAVQLHPLALVTDTDPVVALAGTDVALGVIV